MLLVWYTECLLLLLSVTRVTGRKLHSVSVRTTCELSNWRNNSVVYHRHGDINLCLNTSKYTFPVSRVTKCNNIITLLMSTLRYGLLYRKGEPQGTNPLNNMDLPTWQLAVTVLLLVCLVVAFLILLYEFYSVMG